MKNVPPILGGLIGSIIGFVGTMLLLELVGFGNRNDPIMSGLIGLLISAGGAVGGLLVGTAMGRSFLGGEAAGSAAGASLKSLAVLVALVIIGGVGYYVYSISTATPWLKPGGVVLLYEIRLPANTSVKNAQVDLQTAVNLMPFELHRNKRLTEGDQPVLAAEVDLAFHTAYRQLELKIPDQPVRLFTINIPAAAPHSAQLSGWQKHPDGGEIRYRSKWPGQD